MKVIFSSLYPYIFILLLLLIPLDSHARALPNILLIILGASFLFIVTKKDLQNCKHAVFLIFIGFVFFIIVSSFVQSRLLTDLSIIKKLLLSLAIIVLYLPINDIQKLKNGLLFSSVIIVIISLVKMFFEYMKVGTFDLGNTKFAADALITERLYLGLLSTISIIISISHLSKKYKPENKYNLANIIIQTVFILLITSRIAILSLSVLFLVYQLYRGNVVKRILITASIITLIIFLAFVLNNNLSKRFLFSTPYESQLTFVEKVKRWEPRVVIWNCALSISKNEGIVTSGLGNKKLKNSLVSCYDETITIPSKKEYFLKEKFNTHNQFIDVYLSQGILSLILFISIFICAFIGARRNFYNTAFIIIFFLFSSIENIFHRQMGAYYFGFFLIFILFNTLNREVKLKTYSDV